MNERHTDIECTCPECGWVQTQRQTPEFLPVEIKPDGSARWDWCYGPVVMLCESCGEWSGYGLGSESPTYTVLARCPEIEVPA